MIRPIAAVVLFTFLGASAQDVSSNGQLSKLKLTPEALERSITTSALKFHARAFQTIADLPKSNGTREFGTYGYNASVGPFIQPFSIYTVSQLTLQHTSGMRSSSLELTTFKNTLYFSTLQCPTAAR